MLLLLTSFDNQFLTKAGSSEFGFAANFMRAVPQHDYGSNLVETRRSAFLFRRTTFEESVPLWNLRKSQSKHRRPLALFSHILPLEIYGRTKSERQVEKRQVEAYKSCSSSGCCAASWQDIRLAAWCRPDRERRGA